MRTYGHANRTLVQLSSPSGCDIVEGSLVYSDSVEAGRIATVCYSFVRSSPLALAIIHRKFFNSKSLQLENGEPAEITEIRPRAACAQLEYLENAAPRQVSGFSFPVIATQG